MNTKAHTYSPTSLRFFFFKLALFSSVFLFTGYNAQILVACDEINHTEWIYGDDSNSPANEIQFFAQTLDGWEKLSPCLFTKFSDFVVNYAKKCATVLKSNQQRALAIKLPIFYFTLQRSFSSDLDEFSSFIIG